MGVRVGLGDIFAGFFGRRGSRSGRDGHKNISGSWHDQRRAQRLPITMPVLVYGRVGEEPFFEPTETINVSARGGLVPISAGVARQQELILTNMQTEEDLLCRVARLIRSERGQMLAGLEFVQASSELLARGAFDERLNFSIFRPGQVRAARLISPPVDCFGCRLVSAKIPSARASEWKSRCIHDRTRQRQY